MRYRYALLMALTFILVFSMDEPDIGEPVPTALATESDFVPVNRLISEALKKYGIKESKDCIVWDTPEDIQAMRAGIDPEYKPQELFRELLCMLAKYKSVYVEPIAILTQIFDKDPELKAILKRNGCPVKFFVLNEIAYFYDVRVPQSEHDAYLFVLLDTEYPAGSPEGPLSDLYLLKSYVSGKLLGYPDDAIKSYVGEEYWEKAKMLGEAWLVSKQGKTVPQLIEDIWKLQQRECKLWLLQ